MKTSPKEITAIKEQLFRNGFKLKQRNEKGRKEGAVNKNYDFIELARLAIIIRCNKRARECRTLTRDPGLRGGVVARLGIIMHSAEHGSVGVLDNVQEKEEGKWLGKRRKGRNFQQIVAPDNKSLSKYESKQ